MENYTKKIEPEKTKTSPTSKLALAIFLILFLAFAIFFATFMFASASQENDIITEMIADKGAPLLNNN